MPEQATSTEIELRASCACLNFRMAARSLTQMYDAYLAPAGLRATQFSILSAVAFKEPVALGHLAELLVMDRTTLTRNLKPLERHGLVLGERAADDGRRRDLRLSAAGHELLQRALPLWHEAQSRFVDGFGRERWRLLRGVLGEVTDLARNG